MPYAQIIYRRCDHLLLNRHILLKLIPALAGIFFPFERGTGCPVQESNH